MKIQISFVNFISIIENIEKLADWNLTSTSATTPIHHKDFIVDFIHQS